MCSIPHKTEQSLDVGVSVRKIMSGLCEESRVMISVLEGLWRPVFCVLRYKN